MNWIKLTDELPKHKQNVDLWLQPENGEGRRFNWTWEGQDSAGIMINGIEATHWIDVGKPSEGNPADLGNANCAIFDVSQQRELLLAFFKFATPIYWGENEYTEYEQLIEPFLKANNCG